MNYIGIDGDNIGASLEFHLLQDSEEEIKTLSKEVDIAIISMAESLNSLGMEVIFFSGDSLLCKGISLNIGQLKDIIQAHSKKISFSAGVGNTLRDTYVALKYAKTSGKNRIVSFKNSIYRVYLL